MRRIASLSILFAALIEFAMERARFDLWIITVAMVTLLWNPVGREPRSHGDSQKDDHNVSASKEIACVDEVSQHQVFAVPLRWKPILMEWER
jgi:hypothetical protein